MIWYILGCAAFWGLILVAAMCRGAAPVTHWSQEPRVYYTGRPRKPLKTK